METQLREQTTSNSLLPKVKKQVRKHLREAFQEAGSHKEQFMKVYGGKVVERKNYYSLNVMKYDEYHNIEYRYCLESFKDEIKIYFPKLVDEEIPTEIQWILENKNKIRSNMINIMCSRYFPFAEEFFKFVNDYNINIIVVYNKVHEGTNKNRSLEILKGGNIKTMCLDDINTIPTISSEIKYEIYRLCKKKLL